MLILYTPTESAWASWGGWSGCSATCAGGLRTRIRHCVNGNTCPGPSSNIEPCNQNIDCDPHPNLIGMHCGMTRIARDLLKFNS